MTTGSPNLSAADRVEGLATVWSEATRNYPMWHRLPDLDWDAAFRERIEAVSTAETLEAYYGILSEFAAILRDSHVFVVAPTCLTDRLGAPPVRLWGFDGGFTIVGFEGSLSEASPIALGDRLVAIDDLPVEAHVGQLASRISAATDGFRKVLLARELLKGGAGSEVYMTLAKPAGTTYSMRLVRQSPAELGGTWVRYGPLCVDDRVVVERHEPGVGVFKLSSFMNADAPAQFDAGLVELGPLAGLVLDVRVNTGGNSTFGDAIIGRLIADEASQLPERRAFYSGTLRSWGEGADGTGIVWEDIEGESIAARRDLPTFDGPVAVLVSRATHSAAEDFAGALEGIGRARLVGESTAGSTGNAVRGPLPGGGQFWICSRYQTLHDGTEFIGLGIRPDVEVRTTIQDVAEGRDPVLERAIEEVTA